MAWALEDTDTATVTVASQALTLTGLKFNVFLVHKITTGSLTEIVARFDNDSGTKYARRDSFNGGTDATLINEIDVTLSTGNSDDDEFTVGYFCDVSGEEKLMIHFVCNRANAGAANTPNRKEIVGKFADTTSLTSMDVTYLSNNAGIDTNSTVLGTD